MTITPAYRAAHDATDETINRAQGFAAALELLIFDHEVLMGRDPLSRAIRCLSEAVVQAIDGLSLLRDAEWNAVHLGFAKDTAVMGLYRDWETTNGQIAASAEQCEVGLVILDGLRESLLATRSTCPIDFVAKVVAFSSYGECGLPSESACPDLWAEARVFISDARSS